MFVVSLLTLAGLACAFAAGSGGGRATATPAGATEAVSSPNAVGTPVPTLTPWPTAAGLVTTAEETQLIDLYARVNNSVVSILVQVGEQGFAQGTGFVFDTAGHIVTNQHVVDGGTGIEVDFPSGAKYHGQVVGVDPDADLAVIKLEGVTEALTPLPLADSDQLRVGQRVVAIGNPFGLAGTMTVGIVSGLGRTLSSNRLTETGGAYTAPDIIQTDAAINPGNSGGPLLNLAGEVVGINKALESQTGTNSGVGFAIAANTVRQVVPYLISDGKFVYPYLGITSSGDEITLHVQEVLGLPQATGAYVTSVTPGGPSDQGGLRGDSATPQDQTLRGDGDLIVAVDGQTVRQFSDLMSYLVNHTRPGQTITLAVLRAGRPLDVSVVLGERP
ncbi:MAG: trypsin-like peptidase domain-containing protein [Anaerolineales bacterium]|nr:trypsin-like peptidase domain-containing protein [Anaerolineales bacterium]